MRAFLANFNGSLKAGGFCIRIVDMKLRLETARLLLYKTAWLKQQGKKTILEAALSKLCLSEYFVQSSLDAIRIHGGKGVLKRGRY